MAATLDATYRFSNASIEAERDCRFSRGSQVLSVSGHPFLQNRFYNLCQCKIKKHMIDQE